ncbi:MAG: glycine cleavage system protein T [Rhizobiales bacterium 65-9]|nr:glycine cleavage system aminomethyltransferase GcvT [Hyphomicrobiales bacterium]OJY38118.1 MAG: glycine cleavage system protein T [Rhizobiales bacterium 65-9]
MASPAADAPLLATPLAERHRALGARMVPFAGYDMPVQYPTGILTEHQWTRASAGLFDVSHMGQAFLVPDDGRHETAAAALEALCPADMLNLKPAQQRYSQFLAEDGGILDDFMTTRTGEGPEGSLYLVVNAGCKEADYAHLNAKLPANVKLRRADDLALIALQGPKAEAVLAAHIPDISSLAFMTSRRATIAGAQAQISRSGYTGEDGFEISIAADRAGDLWDLLLTDERVKPIGLGARDSLRLEAGLCLYGHDIDVTTSPVEAALVWSMQKRRREGGGFPGADRIQRELQNGASRQRVGFSFEGRAPAREGAEVRAEGRRIGVVTSGGFGPTVNAPVAMGYVETAFARPGVKVEIIVRDKPLAATVAAMPFAPHHYKR